MPFPRWWLSLAPPSASTRLMTGGMPLPPSVEGRLPPPPALVGIGGALLWRRGTLSRRVSLFSWMALALAPMSLSASRQNSSCVQSWSAISLRRSRHSETLSSIEFSDFSCPISVCSSVTLRAAAWRSAATASTAFALSWRSLLPLSTCARSSFRSSFCSEAMSSAFWYAFSPFCLMACKSWLWPLAVFVVSALISVTSDSTFSSLVAIGPKIIAILSFWARSLMRSAPIWSRILLMPVVFVSTTSTLIFTSSALSRPFSQICDLLQSCVPCLAHRPLVFSSGFHFHGDLLDHLPQVCF